MPDTAPPATSPAPASEAKSSDAKQGASNLTVDQMAKRFLAESPETPTADQTTPEAPATEAPSTPASETEATAPAEAESKETPKETEADTKEDADDVLSQKSSLDQKTKEKIQKRIDKEVGRRKQLEARLAELEGKLTAPPPTQTDDKPQFVPLPEGAPPLANIEAPEGLAKLRKETFEAESWAEELLEHPQVDQGLQIGDRVWTKADLKAVVRQARMTRERDIPARAQFLQQRHAAQQAAHAKFPFLKDKTSEEYVMVQAIFRDMPWLRNTPQGEWIAGLGVKGYKALMAEDAAALKAKEAPKPKVEPPKPPSSQTAVSAGSSARAPAEPAKAQTVGEAFKGKGGITGSEFAAFLAKKERSRNSA